MQWKVGSRLISVTREQNPVQGSEIVSNIFQTQCTVSQISALRNEEVVQDRISILGGGQRQ